MSSDDRMLEFTPNPDESGRARAPRHETYAAVTTSQWRRGHA
jgi:hypothetical protein